eukprot:scaffold639_cov304-Pinguiococcus_pyrenoidosus.AAC.7
MLWDAQDVRSGPQIDAGDVVQGAVRPCEQNFGHTSVHFIGDVRVVVEVQSSQLRAAMDSALEEQHYARVAEVVAVQLELSEFRQLRKSEIHQQLHIRILQGLLAEPQLFAPKHVVLLLRDGPPPRRWRVAHVFGPLELVRNASVPRPRTADALRVLTDLERETCEVN